MPQSGRPASPAASAAAVDVTMDNEPLLLGGPGSGGLGVIGGPTGGLDVGASGGGAGGSAIARWWRRCALGRAAGWLVTACSVSGGVTWIIKGLCICLGMMLMGGVGSFTLHQMMSPQIESLLAQRSSLQKDVEAMQMQIDNMTRIAESRLEMIHLLEKELEKQSVEAAAAAAAAVAPQGSNDTLLRRHGGIRGNVFLPTIFYTWMIVACVLVTVCYRIHRLNQAEAYARKPSHGFASSQSSGDVTSNDMAAIDPSTTTTGSNIQTSTLPASQSHSDHAPMPRPMSAVASTGSRRTRPSSASSPGRTEPRNRGSSAPLHGASECYKRAPGGSPNTLHV